MKKVLLCILFVPTLLIANTVKENTCYKHKNFDDTLKVYKVFEEAYVVQMVSYDSGENLTPIIYADKARVDKDVSNPLVQEVECPR